MSQSRATAKVTPRMSSLFMDFGRYFELSLALTDEQKAAVFGIRYSVYCEEFGYEDAQAFKDRLERDLFDDRSVHCIVTHKATNSAAGCVRLVTVDDDTLLPIEEHCADALDKDFLAQMSRHRDSMAEISRLAVDGKFRRRRGEQETRFGNTETLHFAAREQRTFSVIAVALFLASASVADLMRRRDCFAIMEPFLPVILRRTGIVVKRVGEDFDYRGIRAPYYLNISDAARALPDDLRLCYEAIKSQFAETLEPQGQRAASRIAAPKASWGNTLALPPLDFWLPS